MPEQYKVAIIEDLDGLRELGPEWNEIAPPKEVAPWQSFSWMEAAATAFTYNQSLHVITVRKNGRLVAVAPFVLKHFEQILNPVRLGFLGAVELKEPNRFIARDPVSLELLLEAILSEPMYPIRLARIPNDGENIRSIIAKFRKSGWIIPAVSRPYPYIEPISNPIKKSLREDLRRARRKAKEYGEVKAEMTSAATREELQEYIDVAFQIEGSGWKGESNTAILSIDARRQFFERYAFAAWKDDTLRLSFLTINGRRVAEQYAIESANSYWLLNIGYDEEYRRCSPGNLLLEESIKYAARKGLCRYNFLGKEEAWIARWTESAQDCVILAAYRLNPYSLRALCADVEFLIEEHIKGHNGELT
ncbi:MAG: GNAT family N-acetyltransferase [Anaerolineae bacterium]|nr:GNAT family N-acetyltransferase [Anaerolineae bacterium]